MKIVPSADLGDMGLQQGEPASFNWKWYYSAARWIIWLVLAGALVIPKSNRNARALLILIPLGIVNLLWWIFLKNAKMNSTDALEFGIIFHSMAIGVTVLWLVANNFKTFGGAIRLLLSFVTVVGVAGLGTLAYSTEFSAETALFLVLFAFLALTLLVGATLSRRLCGGTYRPVRFMLWLALWMLLISLIGTSGFIIIGSTIFPSASNFSLEAIVIFVLGGLVFGLFLYVLNLPYMILGFAQPFFRERLCACVGFQSVRTIEASETCLDRQGLQDANTEAS